MLPCFLSLSGNLLREGTKSKLASFMSCCPTVFLTKFVDGFFPLHDFMPRFPFYVTHHLWECISTCGTNLLLANEFHRWLKLLRATL